jgi:hypothetical protein
MYGILNVINSNWQRSSLLSTTITQRSILQTTMTVIDTHHHFVPEFYAQGNSQASM